MNYAIEILTKDLDLLKRLRVNYHNGTRVNKPYERKLVQRIKVLNNAISKLKNN